MSQTTVPANQAVSYAGMLGDATTDNVDSMVSTEASAEVPFGVMVQHGTADTDAKLLSATSNKLAGVVLQSHAYAVGTELGTVGLLPKASLSVLRQGKVWVNVEEAVAVGGAVRVRAAGTGTKGGFLTTASATNTIDCSKFCRFLTSTSGAGLALVEIDMSGAAGAVAD